MRLGWRAPCLACLTRAKPLTPKRYTVNACLARPSLLLRPALLTPPSSLLPLPLSSSPVSAYPRRHRTWTTQPALRPSRSYLRPDHPHLLRRRRLATEQCRYRTGPRCQTSSRTPPPPLPPPLLLPTSAPGTGLSTRSGFRQRAPTRRGGLPRLGRLRRRSSLPRVAAAWCDACLACPSGWRLPRYLAASRTPAPARQCRHACMPVRRLLVCSFAGVTHDSIHTSHTQTASKFLVPLAPCPLSV